MRRASSTLGVAAPPRPSNYPVSDSICDKGLAAFSRRINGRSELGLAIECSEGVGCISKFYAAGSARAPDARSCMGPWPSPASHERSARGAAKRDVARSGRSPALRLQAAGWVVVGAGPACAQVAVEHIEPGRWSPPRSQLRWIHLIAKSPRTQLRASQPGRRTRPRLFG